MIRPGSLFLLILCVFASIQAQDIDYESFSITDGLSQNLVNTVYQDQFGLLWVGTQSGIDRYDGYRFQHFSERVFQGTKTNIQWCHAIAEDSVGNLWFGDQLGNVSFLDRQNLKWTNFNLLNDEDEMRRNLDLNTGPFRIFALWVSPNSEKAWVGTEARGLFQIDRLSGEVQKYQIRKGEENQPWIYFIKEWQDGWLIGTDAGLYFFNGERFESLLAQYEVRDIIPNPNGGWLLATSNGLVLSNSTFETFEFLFDAKFLESALGTASFMNLAYAETKSRLYLVIENIGLAVWDFETALPTRVSLEQKYQSRRVFNEVLIDRQGIIWLASNSRGLLKSDEQDQKLQLISRESPAGMNLGFDVVWGVIEDSEGRIWAGNVDPGGGIYRYDPKSRERKILSDGLPRHANDFKYRRILEDAVGNVWILFNERSKVLIQRVRKGSDRVEILGFDEELNEGKQISARSSYYKDQYGQIVYCGDNEIIRFTDPSGNLMLDDYEPLMSLNDERIKDFFVPPDSTHFAYIATNKAIYAWWEEENRLEEVFRLQEGTFTDLGFLNGLYFAIRGDKGYIVTYGKGLLELNLRAGSYRYITEKDGLPSRFLYSILMDEQQNIWMSSNYGIISFDPDKFTFRSYGPDDGAQGYEYNATTFWQNEEGVMYFGGINGLNRLDPNKFNRAEQEGPLHIEEIVSFGDPKAGIAYDQSEPLVVDYANNSLEFNYLGVDFRRAQNLNYRYRLLGYEDEWTNAGERRFASFTNLFEGKYTFEVQLSTAEGGWSSKTASVRLKILPPWYRSWWAILSYVFFVGIAIYSYNRVRVKQLYARSERERRESEMQAARELQERMLPRTVPEFEGWKIKAYQQTSSEVGGDYYDFLNYEDGTPLVVCGDATGHGMASGMLVSVTKSGLYSLDDCMPDAILSRINRTIKKVNVGMLRMSLLAMRLEPKKVIWSAAAMPPVYIYRAATNEVEEYLYSELPLGAFTNQQYEIHESDIAKGDVVLILSDGLPEAPNTKGELFEYERVKEMMRVYGSKGAETLAYELEFISKKWLGNQTTPDDITFVVVEKAGSNLVIE